MRRLAILAGRLTSMLLMGAGLAGCGSFRDLFSAHADVAAEVGAQRLSAQRLAEIMVGAGKGARISQDAGTFVANVWVDYALLGKAVAAGRLPTDSASVAEAVWPELSELRGVHWHDSLAARRGGLTDGQVDSVFQNGDVRVLQHILFGARQNATPAARAAARQKAEAALAKVRRGTSFSQLAAQLSDDPGSRADSGYLPVSPRGRFVPAFDSVGWVLQPGQVSGLVETPFGYHIIKRPAAGDVRDRVSDYLLERAGVRLDSMYLDSLGIANQVAVVSGAPAAMRAAIADQDGSRKSTKALVRFRGGALTVQEYLRWVRALPPQITGQLRSADDTVLARFAHILAQNVLLLRQADSAKVSVTAEEWGELSSRYLSQLDTLKAEIGLDGADVSDSGIAEAEREKVAGLKVERYFDDLVNGKARLRPLPSALATLLRDRLPYRVHAAGVTTAVELATDLKAKTDSTAPGKGPLTPAPGPAPVPGAAPAPVDTTGSSPRN